MEQRLNTKWINRDNVQEVAPDFVHYGQFVYNLKKNGAISKVVQERRPRKDIGRGTEALIDITYVDLEDAIDVYLGLTKTETNSYKQHMRYLDILFMIKGRFDERDKFAKALAV